MSVFADNKMVETLAACEPDMLQVANVSHTLETDQRVLGQLSDLYDRELVGIIGNYYGFNAHVKFSLFNSRLNLFYRLGQADSRIQ